MVALMRIKDIISRRYKLDNLADFEKAHLVLQILQTMPPHVKLQDKEYPTLFFLKAVENGCVYIEPDFYANEEIGVQLRVPLLDLLEYEIV